MQHQSGSALVISLIILVVITLGAVLAMQQSNLQLKMLGNFQHKQELFEYTLGEANYLARLLRTDDQARHVLATAIAATDCDETTHICTGGTDPFAAGHFSQKDPAARFNPASHTLTALSKAIDSPHSLKENEGSSSSTLIPYYFKNSIHSTDINEQASANQEIGFYYLAPAM